eukprot:6490497-Prymnesium_polylepis.1
MFIATVAAVQAPPPSLAARPAASGPRPRASSALARPQSSGEPSAPLARAPRPRRPWAAPRAYRQSYDQAAASVAPSPLRRGPSHQPLRPPRHPHSSCRGKIRPPSPSAPQRHPGAPPVQ